MSDEARDLTPERDVNEPPKRDNARATRMMHGMGRFFMVIGVLNFVIAAIALVVLLVTGDYSEGLALVVMGLGSGVAWYLIGYAMRRLTF